MDVELLSASADIGSSLANRLVHHSGASQLFACLCRTRHRRADDERRDAGASLGTDVEGCRADGAARGWDTVKIVGEQLRLSASDVANFVACQHLIRLDLLHARHQLRRVQAFDLGFEDLVKRGEAHEAEVLNRFRADGRSIAEISIVPDADAVAEAARATREAIRAGPTSSTRGRWWAGARTARLCWGGRTS